MRAPKYSLLRIAVADEQLLLQLVKIRTLLAKFIDKFTFVAGALLVLPEPAKDMAAVGPEGRPSA